MTTLLIIVFLIGGTADGGAAVHTEKIQFQQREQCEAASKAIAGDNHLWAHGMGKGGRYRILAVCMKTA